LKAGETTLAKEKWRSDFKRLWNELVPLQGQADTVQGELIRAVGRLSDEAFRNGNRNFNKNHQLLCSYVRRTLDDPSVFGPDDLAEIGECIKRIRKSREPDICGQNTCFHLLVPLAVRWCESYPKLIPRESDPALRI